MSVPADQIAATIDNPTPAYVSVQSNSTSPDWSTMLLTGVSAAIDSQLAGAYGLNNPVYNSMYGPGGQGQYPPGTRFDIYGNPIPGSASVSASASSSTLLYVVIGAVLLVMFMRK